MREFSSSEPVSNDRFVMYVMQRGIGQLWHGFIMIQGARNAGRFTVEMAIALHPRYPISHARARPSLAVDGVRERAGGLHNHDDQWWEYQTQDQLESRLREVTERVASTGFRHLYEMCGTSLVRESKLAQDLLNHWEEEEQLYAERPLGARFSGLMLELRVHDYITRTIFHPELRPVLGSLRPRFDDARWLSAMVYVMSSLMEMGEPDEMAQNIHAPSLVNEEMITLCGRVPYYSYLDPADDFDERVNRFCFFKALNILEAQFEPRNRLSLQTGTISLQEIRDL